MKKVNLLAVIVYLLSAMFLIIATTDIAEAYSINSTDLKCNVGSLAEDTESFSDVASWDAQKFITEFLSACPDRSGTADEKSAADWLVGCFESLVSQVGFDVELQPYGDGDAVTGYNVEVRSNINSDKQVIIGAHYDSIGEGANDNASGVAAMFLAMKALALSQDYLAFNVVFVAFGGEESGLLGSAYYLSEMQEIEINNTLVMFNLDSVGGGDNLYVFCENKSTALADLILANACGGGALLEKPYAQGVFALDVYGYGYYEFIQGSDHTAFRLQGIPTALFFAGNYSGRNYVESVDSSKNVMNTDNDKLDKMDEFWGDEFYVKIDTVASTLVATLKSDSFLNIAENARSQLINNDVVFGTFWPMLAAFCLIGIYLLFAGLYYRKLQKRSILGTAEAKEKHSVFTQPKAEDIFDFGDDEK